MRKLVLVLLPAGLLFCSCGSNVNSGKLKYGKLEVKALSEEDMYTHVMVKAYQDHKDESKSEHNDLFLKGLDSYKNKKNLDSAEYYFKKSILSYPTNLAYYELGNVLLDKKSYHKSIYSYEMAEKMGYEPFSKVLYNISCAHSLMDETDLAGQYLEFAIQAGYSNIDNINTDKDLANLRNESYNFEYHLKRGLKGLSNVENLYWLQFKRKFNRTPFPLTLDENLDMLLLNDETRISYDFEKYIAEMRDEKFSREVSKGFYYLANLKETDEYIALVYVIKEEFYGQESPLTFRLVTFNNQGKLIDKKEIAGRSDFSKPLKAATIGEDLSILISYYETVFEKDVEEEGYYNNKVLEKTKLYDETFSITANGKIVKQENAISSSSN